MVISAIIFIQLAFAQLGEQGTQGSAANFNSFYMKQEIVGGVPQDVVYYKKNIGSVAQPVDRAFLVSLLMDNDIKAMQAWQDFLTEHEPFALWQYVDKQDNGAKPKENMRHSLYYLPTYGYITGETLTIPESVGKAQALSFLTRYGVMKADCVEILQDTIPPYEVFFSQKSSAYQALASKSGGEIIDNTPLCELNYEKEEIKRYVKGALDYRDFLLYHAKNRTSFFNFSIISSAYAQISAVEQAQEASQTLAEKKRLSELFASSYTINVETDEKPKFTKEELNGSDEMNEIYIEPTNTYDYEEGIRSSMDQNPYEVMGLAKKNIENLKQDKLIELVDNYEQGNDFAIQVKLEEIQICDQMSKEFDSIQYHKEQLEEQMAQRDSGSQEPTAVEMPVRPGGSPITLIADHSFEELEMDNSLELGNEIQLDPSMNATKAAMASINAAAIVPLPPNSRPTVSKLETVKLGVVLAEVPELEIDLTLAKQKTQSLWDKITKAASTGSSAAIKAALEEVKFSDDEKLVAKAKKEIRTREVFKKNEDELITSVVNFDNGFRDERKINQEQYFNRFVTSGDFIDYSTIDKQERKEEMAKDIIINAKERNMDISTEAAMMVAKEYVENDEDTINFDKVLGKKEEISLAESIPTETKSQISKRVELQSEINQLRKEIFQTKDESKRLGQIAQLDQLEKQKKQMGETVSAQLAEVEKKVRESQALEERENLVAANSQLASAKSSGSLAGSSNNNSGRTRSISNSSPIATTAPFTGSYDDYIDPVNDLWAEEKKENVVQNDSQNKEDKSRSPASIQKTSQVKRNAKASDLKKDYLKYVRYEDGKYYLYSEITKEKDKTIIKKNMDYLKENAKKIHMIDYSNANNPLIGENKDGEIHFNGEHQLSEKIKDSKLSDFVKVQE
jgi:hypothetical protein